MEVLKIDYSNKNNHINDLYQALDEVKSKWSNIYSLTKVEKEVLNTLYETLDKCVDENDNIYEGLYKFFEDKFNRYWDMKIVYVAENTGTVYTREYVIYPYRIVEANHYLCCVRSENIDKNNGFNAELTDGGFMLEDFFSDNCEIQLEELTREEFIDKATNQITKIIDNRIDKLSNTKEDNNNINVKL